MLDTALFLIFGTSALPCRFLHRSYLSHLGKATNTETHTAYNQRKCSPLENQQNKREHERSVIAVIAFCILRLFIGHRSIPS